VAEELAASFGSRFVMHEGSSAHTVPAWRRSLAQGGECVCDLIFVDGDHSMDGALKDIEHVATLASTAAALVVDDVMVGPGRALNVTTARNLTRVVELFGPFRSGSRFNPCRQPLVPGGRSPACPHWGFAVSRFLGSDCGHRDECTARGVPSRARRTAIGKPKPERSR